MIFNLERKLCLQNLVFSRLYSYWMTSIIFMVQSLQKSFLTFSFDIYRIDIRHRQKINAMFCIFLLFPMYCKIISHKFFPLSCSCNIFQSHIFFGFFKWKRIFNECICYIHERLILKQYKNTKLMLFCILFS